MTSIQRYRRVEAEALEYVETNYFKLLESLLNRIEYPVKSFFRKPAKISKSTNEDNLRLCLEGPEFDFLYQALLQFEALGRDVEPYKSQFNRLIERTQRIRFEGLRGELNIKKQIGNLILRACDRLFKSENAACDSLERIANFRGNRRSGGEEPIDIDTFMGHCITLERIKTNVELRNRETEDRTATGFAMFNVLAPKPPTVPGRLGGNRKTLHRMLKRRSKTRRNRKNLKK
jgi:hypothetical protein